MRVSSSDSGLDSPVLNLSGPLTIFTVAAERHRLLSALSHGGAICLDLSGVTECDAAGLQLLCSLLRTAHTKGVACQLRGATAVVLPCAVALGLEPAPFQA